MDCPVSGAHKEKDFQIGFHARGQACQLALLRLQAPFRHRVTRMCHLDPHYLYLLRYLLLSVYLSAAREASKFNKITAPTTQGFAT